MFFGKFACDIAAQMKALANIIHTLGHHEMEMEEKKEDSDEEYEHMEKGHKDMPDSYSDDKVNLKITNKLSEPVIGTGDRKKALLIMAKR